MSFFENLDAFKATQIPGNPAPASAQEAPEFDVLKTQAKLAEDKKSSIKAGDTSVTGTASKKALDEVRGLQSALAADSAIADLTPMKNCFIRDNLSEFVNFSKNRNPNGWGNFVALEDNDVASFFSKVNGFYTRSMLPFLNMETKQKAALYPKINIFKVEGSRETQISFPTSIEELQHPDALQSILSLNTHTDYGLKSVEFDFKNQNAFGAGRIVDVRIQIFLLTGQALLIDRGGFRIADLVLRRGQVDAKAYDSKSYELRLDVGYYPINVGNNLLAPLQDNMLSMILNLVEYDLDIMDNGVINLTMNYKARIEQDLEDRFDYDVFEFDRSAHKAAVKELEERVLETAEEINKLSKNLKAVEAEKIYENNRPQNLDPFAAASQGVRPHDWTDAGSESKEQGIRIKRAKGELARAKAKSENYKLRLKELSASNRIIKWGGILETMTQTNKIQAIQVPKTALIIYGKEFEKILQDKIDQAAKDSGITKAEDLVRATNQIRRQAKEAVRKRGTDMEELDDLNLTAIVNAKANREGIDKRAALLSLDLKDSLGTRGSPATLDSKSKLTEEEADSTEKYSGKEKIYWFTLGDLINAAVAQNNIPSKLNRDHLGFIFGPLNVEVQTGEFITAANIADIPITLDMYQQFFYKNIVEKELDEYYLHDFLQQVIQQLLMPTLNQKCFGTSVNTRTKINNVVVEISRPIKSVYSSSNKLGKTPLAGGLLFKGNRFYMTPGFKDSLAQSRINVKNVTPDKRWNYIVFYSNDGRASSEWKGIESDDRKKGIFHFRPGIDRGLVKQVKFRKNKQPGFTTMMVERAFRENEESIQLWATFDIDLALIGNSLLKPGMHIYLDPSTVGMGSPQNRASFSRSIGLGGYYLVTAVSNTIQDGDWETNVVAKWVTSGAISGAAGGGSSVAAATPAPASVAKGSIGKKKKPASKKKKSTGKKKKSKKSASSGGPTTQYYLNERGEYIYYYGSKVAQEAHGLGPNSMSGMHQSSIDAEQYGLGSMNDNGVSDWYIHGPNDQEE